MGIIAIGIRHSLKGTVLSSQLQDTLVWLRRKTLGKAFLNDEG